MKRRSLLGGTVAALGALGLGVFAARRVRLAIEMPLRAPAVVAGIVDVTTPDDEWEVHQWDGTRHLRLQFSDEAYAALYRSEDWWKAKRVRVEFLG
jgi:hypothetical protein